MVAGDRTKFATITSDQLGGNFDQDINYLGMSEVNWEVDGIIYSLADAIRDGITSVEEIFAYARIDARNGICTEEFTSKNGLAYFTYAYPEFDLRMTYDVYETPDGQQHLVNDIGIYASGADVFTAYTDEETGVAIDREDWGLTFDVTETTPTSITLDCTQSGGQQIGELQIDYYYNIYSVVDGQTMLVPSLQGTMTYTEETLPPPIADIKQDGSTRFTIDWTEKYGELDSGEYKIKLSVNDIFDESQVHPLMQDYFDRQSYWVEFTIPEA